MANSFFKFKQFTVQQDACAMKVTTDACLFGAWCAAKINLLKPTYIVDIGTGTGLLSLMLAQNTNATIDAVEINEQAASQAKQNINTSLFENKITVYHSPIQNFETNILYDFIITNPPFFENDLLSNSTQRNTALHSTQLQLTELIEHLKRLLKPNGYFAILLPYHRTAYFENLAKDFYLIEKTFVQQTPQHSFFRTMLLYSNSTHQHSQENHICIHQSNNTYTTAFTELLKPYYLYL
ncbi:MAG: methyltransferase [Chitinophagaceae bacterium]|nr:methyltransferase [Chitinophagaceae bacterium]MCW5904470.1 methyltransferase [Chitinophagaceae bacterium]